MLELRCCKRDKQRTHETASNRSTVFGKMSCELLHPYKFSLGGAQAEVRNWLTEQQGHSCLLMVCCWETTRCDMLTAAADSQTAGTRHPGLDGLQVPERSSGSWGLACVVFGFSPCQRLRPGQRTAMMYLFSWLRLPPSSSHWVYCVPSGRVQH